MMNIGKEHSKGFLLIGLGNIYFKIDKQRFHQSKEKLKHLKGELDHTDSEIFKYV